MSAISAVGAVTTFKDTAIQSQSTKASESFGSVLEKVKHDNTVTDSLSRMSSYADEMKEIISVALGKKQLTQQELLMLQAKCHKISFELSMASKIVETGVGSIKTTMQTQV